jgi:hypothetical protein
LSDLVATVFDAVRRPSNFTLAIIGAVIATAVISLLLTLFVNLID